jgi:hypothetical protein
MSMMDIDHQGPNGSISDEQPVTGIIYPPPDIRSKIYYRFNMHNSIIKNMISLYRND